MFSSRKTGSASNNYLLTRSLRFRSSASAYLNKTFASNGTRTKGTYSTWFKIGTLPSTVTIPLFGCGNTANDSDSSFIAFFPDFGTGVAGTLALVARYGGGTVYKLFTSAVFRDPSAWYHIVVSWDTTLATPSGKIYINGVEQSYGTNTWGTQPQNQNTYFSSSAYPSVIGKGANNADSAKYADGYMAEINFIDGQALTPTSFGSTNAATGVWQPIKYTGTYGTNGFYLPFTNTTSTSTLGNDFSGNSNTWTVNNISLTAGTTYDSMTDVPTNTDTNTANYCTWNPLDKGTVTVTNANLSAVSAADTHAIRATMGLPLTGKFYWETTVSGLGYGSVLGIANAASSVTTGPSSAETRTYQWGSWFNSFNSGVVQYGTNQAITSGTNWSGASQLAANDVLMIAVDMDNGSMWVGKNGTWFNSSGTANPATNTDPRWTGLGGTTWFAYYSGYGSVSPVTANINFGQRPFAYTPPTGFKALNTFNLPTPTIGASSATQANKYFNAVLRNGYGSSGGTLDCGFQPDFVWEKTRSAASSHTVWDSVRGLPNALRPNETTAELSQNWLTGFVSNGLTFGTNDYGTGVTLVEWVWKANQGTNVTNTSGSITSTVSANTTAGFSIVTYTGNGSNSTIGHGLGVAPSFIIAKARNSAQRWTVYTAALGNGYYGYLNETFAFDTANASLRWNTAPTSSVFGVGTSVDVNNNTTTYVAYCFAQVAGYSAFGSYTGNGSSDGPFVFTGFRPRFVLVKESSASGNNWVIYDTARDTYNECSKILYPNLSNAEFDGSTVNLDILSNGFKPRDNWGGNNNSGSTYIYAAFAESPFKYANAR